MADATQPSVYLRSRLLRRSDASSRPLRGWEFPDPHPPSIGRGVAGIRPAFSTGGGTSDARFLSKLCPTVEFGLVNATMHKLDEAVAVADLRALTRIYGEVLRRALG